MTAPTTYCVHVLGPDDVLEQPDRATAVRVAHQINTEIAAIADAVLNDAEAEATRSHSCRFHCRDDDRP